MIHPKPGNCLMRKRIRRVSVFQTAKVSAVLYGLMGLLAVPFVFLASMLSPGETNLFGIGAGLVGAIMLPVIYAVFGFIFTAIGCAIYNAVAGVIGGIEFEVEDVVSYGA